MAIASYEIKVSNVSDRLYFFESEGSSGTILKVVIFEPMNEPGRFNLGMADWIDGELNYENISHHKDLDKVFSSVSIIIRHFLYQDPDREIFITGDTAAKMRLYRMKVSNNLEVIQKEFNIHGTWGENVDYELFRTGQNYLGLLISNKIE